MVIAESSLRSPALIAGSMYGTTLQLVQVRQALPVADILKDGCVGGARVVLKLHVEGLVAHGLLFAHQAIIVQVFASQYVSSFQHFLLMRKKILPRTVDARVVRQAVADALPLAPKIVPLGEAEDRGLANAAHAGNLALE
jgi:hypothetical protein